MKIRNVHERTLDVASSRVGALLDSLGSSKDKLWPHHMWPAMRFDRPLGVGAVGGHGPIRYSVEEYEPRQRVRFRFTAPRGFNGTHEFDIKSLGADRTRLRHILEMQTAGTAIVSWQLVFRPLHDALLEDALDLAEQNVGTLPNRREWSLWVKALRWLISGGQAKSRSNA